MFNFGNMNWEMISKFAEFKQSMKGKNPEAIINQMLKDGKITTEQLEQLKKRATSLMGILR